MSEYQNPFSDRKHYSEHTEWIEKHLSKFFEDSLISVFHEIPTLDLHLDIYLIKPENTSFNILLTSGMSTLEMEIPETIVDSDELKFTELMMLVPKNIEFEQVYSGKNKNDWILTILKRTAKFPHFYNTWLGVGHTVQASEDLKSYGEDTNFVGALILPSVTFDKSFTEINKDGRKINIYNVFPLYENELQFKVKNGYSKLLDLLIEFNGKEILDFNRDNLIPKKTFWNRITGN